MEFTGADAPVDAISVYRDSVVVHRKLKVTVQEAGECCVKISLLPHQGQHLSTDSLRVSLISGGGAVKLLRARAYATPITYSDIFARLPAAAKLYEDIVDHLQRRHKLQGVNDLIKMKGTFMALSADGLTDSKRKMLANFPGLELDGSEGDISQVLKRASRFTQALHKMQFTSAVEEHKNKIEMCNLNDEILKLMSRLSHLCGVRIHLDMAPDAPTIQNSLINQLTSQNGLMERILHCEFQTMEPDLSFEAEVSYELARTGWYPTYHIRIDSANLERVGFEYCAALGETGESWDNVSISLHTSTACGHPPNLPRLTVGVEKPPVIFSHHRGLAYAKSRMAAPMMVVMDAAGDESVPAPEIQQARVDPTKKFQAVFELPKRLSVPAETTGHELFINQSELNLSEKHVYYAVPEISSDVYMVGFVTNTSPFTLIEGTASVYWDGAASAKSQIGQVGPGQEFHTFFGTDHRVKLQVKPLKQFRKTTGIKFLSAQGDKDSFELCTKITNSHESRSISLVMPFRVPSSSDADIVVALDSSMKYTEKTAEQDVELANEHKFVDMAENQIVWVLNSRTNNVVALAKIGPKQAVPVTFAYTIERPIGRAIVVKS